MVMHSRRLRPLPLALLLVGWLAALVPMADVPRASAATVDRVLTLPFLDADIKIQQGYHYTFSTDTHEGIDYIKGAIDQSSSWQSFDVVAAADGEATYETGAEGWGNYVRIKTEFNGSVYYTLYAHLESSSLPEGQPTPVGRGTFIGRAGKSGSGSNNVTHLHFEFSRDQYGAGFRLDPYDLYTTREAYPALGEAGKMGANYAWLNDPPAVPPSGPGVCGPMDVAFVVDTSTSMGGALTNVKAELASILGDIEQASLNDYRLALVEFNDGVGVLENFAANNRPSVEATFQSLFLHGGGFAEPEPSDEALNTVINALPAANRSQNIDFTPAFRAHARKVIILVTDARPGGFNDAYTPGVDDINAHNRALEAAAKQMSITAIFVPTSFSPGNHPKVREIMTDYAETTGGVFLEANGDGRGTSAAIRAAIARCGSGQVDSDGDGLPDEWEQNGIPGADLPAMGADPSKKDIFVQVDWMEQAGRSQKPDARAIETVVKAFAEAPVDGGRGINLHVDVGPQSTDYVTGKPWGALARGHAIGFRDVLGGDTGEALVNDVLDQLYDGQPRQSPLVFHYALFIHTFRASAQQHGFPSGVSLGSQVFLVSLGDFANGKGSWREQAGTFMHELGHNLGLGHGGQDTADEFNHKPNYLSVMNYSFQMGGLIKRQGEGSVDGHYDYSRAELATLDEASLDEQAGLAGADGYGTKYNVSFPWICLKDGAQLIGLHTFIVVPNAAAPIDWSCNGVVDNHVVKEDLNGTGGDQQKLRGHDDWGHLVYQGGNSWIGLGVANPVVTVTTDDVRVAPREITPEQDRAIARLGEPRVEPRVTASPGAVLVRSTVTYSVTLRNLDAGDAYNPSVQLVLPPGFTYVPGSTTGDTRSDPGGSGRTLTWSLGSPLAAYGTRTLRFQARASATPGAYAVHVTGTSSNGVVVTVEQAAPITVQALPGIYLPIIRRNAG